MPSDFQQQFPNTRVILDATEVPVEKPKYVISQTSTWSNYKRQNTLKTMIGCSPRGQLLLYMMLMVDLLVIDR